MSRRTQRSFRISPIRRRSCVADSASAELSRSGHYEAVGTRKVVLLASVSLGLLSTSYCNTTRARICSTDLPHPQGLVRDHAIHAFFFVFVIFRFVPASHHDKIRND